MNDYLNMAWEDFIQNQIQPFGRTQFFIGIGNHELGSNRTREEFRYIFQKWLTQEPIHGQRMKDAAKGLHSSEGETHFHFVHRGVDFIILDNADTSSFSAAQIVWLSKVLAEDRKDDSVKTLVVGMHAALPFSKSRGHAMDATCQGLCSGQQVYDMLVRAQNLGGPAEKQKHVYILASHFHTFQENVYDTPEHQGQVLPGWIVGTAGAEQYSDTIRYGYLQLEVREDGTLHPVFKGVTADSPPLGTGAGSEALTRYCFEQNKRPAALDNAFKGECACGAAR